MRRAFSGKVASKIFYHITTIAYFRFAIHVYNPIYTYAIVHNIIISRLLRAHLSTENEGVRK